MKRIAIVVIWFMACFSICYTAHSIYIRVHCYMDSISAIKVVKAVDYEDYATNDLVVITFADGSWYSEPTRNIVKVARVFGFGEYGFPLSSEEVVFMHEELFYYNGYHKKLWEKEQPKLVPEINWTWK